MASNHFKFFLIPLGTIQHHAKFPCCWSNRSWDKSCLVKQQNDFVTSVDNEKGLG